MLRIREQPLERRRALGERRKVRRFLLHFLAECLIRGELRTVLRIHLLELRPELFECLLFAGDALLALLDAALAREQVAALAAAGAARHGAGRSDGIAVQRDEFERTRELARDARGVPDGVADERVVQQVAHDVGIIGIVLHELVRKAERALLLERRLHFARIAVRAHGIHGQEGDDAAVRAL